VDDLRFHLKTGNFLAQAEIISVLSPTQSNSEKLGPAQFQFSLGLTICKSLSFRILGKGVPDVGPPF